MERGWPGVIDTVWFENEAGEIFRPADYGIILKSYDAPLPAPKINRVTLEGMDGDVDMTEWAGEVRYNTRSVTAAFRDMSGEEYKKLMNFACGQKVKLTNSAAPDYYFTGRCERADAKIRRRIADVTLQFVCDPYMLRHTETSVIKTFTDSADILLMAERKSAIPKITVSEDCVIRYGNISASLRAGTYTVQNLIITNRPETLHVTGSGTIKIVWRDGVL